MINDQTVIEYIDSHIRVSWKHRDINIINYLLNRFGIFTVDNIYDKCRESLFRIRYNINILPKCPICGNTLKYRPIKNSYEVACCREHVKQILNIRKSQTCLKKYGTISPLLNDAIKNKTKLTMLLKYGVENIAQSKYWKDSVNKTSLEKYNTLYPNLSELVKEKIKNTLYLHYGVDNYLKTEDAKRKANSKEAIIKGIETKRKNNTLRFSTPENEIYLLLKLYFNNVLREYISDPYPYHCDFYIPDILLYIECNFHWTHGYHPFNSNNMDDIKILEKWKSKAIQSKYYEVAIYVWTILDVKKRTIATQNNLNYIEIWNKNEINKILKLYGNID